MNMRKTHLQELKFANKGILLIDDDPEFGAVVQTLAAAKGIPLVYYQSLMDMGTFARLGEFDVAIIDYKMDALNGIEVAEYIEVFFSDIPVILVSAANLEDISEALWPRCVRRFVSKDIGVYGILNSAMELVQSKQALA